MNVQCQMDYWLHSACFTTFKVQFRHLAKIHSHTYNMYCDTDHDQIVDKTKQQQIELTTNQAQEFQRAQFSFYNARAMSILFTRCALSMHGLCLKSLQVSGEYLKCSIIHLSHPLLNDINTYHTEACRGGVSVDISRGLPRGISTISATRLAEC